MLKFMKRSSRGCGVRDEKGFYIMCGGVPLGCHRLPLDVPICPECGQYRIPFKIRGVAKFNPRKVFGCCEKVAFVPVFDKTNPIKYDYGFQGHFPSCELDGMRCPVCVPPTVGWYMSVGEDNYSTKSFMEEASLMGISKKVRSIPEDMKPGDILYLGFRKAVFDCHAGEDGEGEWIPQVFCAAPITGFEKLVTRAQIADKQYMRELEERGIDAVVEYDDPVEVADLLPPHPPLPVDG